MKRRKPKRRARPSNSGLTMKTWRNDLRMTMREVEEASKRIAKKNRNRKYIISPSRLSDIELGGLAPNIFRLAALSKIYGIGITEMLSNYGIVIS